jgi:hypothetical protein
MQFHAMATVLVSASHTFPCASAPSLTFFPTHRAFLQAQAHDSIAARQMANLIRACQEEGSSMM